MRRWLLALVSVLSIAIGTAILTGAILAGDSVAADLRKAASLRAGRAAYVISSRNFFREELGDEVARTGGWRTCPLIEVDGATEKLRAVKVYGVDDRFWKFQGKPIPRWRGKTLVRIDKPSPVPAETLFGPKSEQPMFIELPFVEDAFALAEGPDPVASIFVPYDLLQHGFANRILVAARTSENETAAIVEAVRERSVPEDLGVRFSDTEDGPTVVRSDSMVMPDTLVTAITAAAQRIDVPVSPVSSYKAKAIRAGGRAIFDQEIQAVEGVDPTSIVLNPAVARELQVKPGDQVTLEYDLWQNGVFAPATTIKWGQTPFPPKKGSDPFLLALGDGQRMWGTRFGSVTSITATLRSPEITGEDGLGSFRIAVQKAIDPFRLGFSIRDLRPGPPTVTDFTARLLICVALPILAAFFLGAVAFARSGLDPLIGFVLPIAGTGLGIGAVLLYSKSLFLGLLWGGLFALGLASFCIVAASFDRSKWVRFVCTGLAAVAVLTAQGLRTTPTSDYNVVAESRAPVIWNPGAPEGAKALNLPVGPQYYAFRVRPGGDASARNPVKPRIPALLGAPQGFLDYKDAGPDFIPALADTASHFHVRDEIVIDRPGDTPVRIRITGSLKNSPLQSYVIMSEENFLKAFPETEGYRFFLARGGSVSAMNSALSTYGLNAEPVETRLARYKEVRERWISLFQIFGIVAVVLFGISTIPVRGGK